ncbi:MAG TPA: tetratricopeptide repeat protein [Gemmataceae bacterium]|nr:tetratricopeptide repeat protein [Gemmataceae bacterium]
MPVSLWKAPARLAVAAVLLGAAALPAQQVTPDQAADMLLTSAKTAYNTKDFAFAAGRFREFLAKFPNHKDAAAAHYGLALAILDGPDKDYNAAVEQLQPLAGAKDAPDYPFYLYYLGLAERGQGVKFLAQAAAQPPQAQQFKDQARGRFDEAAKQFAAAQAAFSARVKPPDADAKELPIDLEWSARARCDLAEMRLRLLDPKGAREAVEIFTTDKLLAKSRYHGLGLYYHGFACFQLHDDQAAGRSLTDLAPFTDPVYGGHARYLLARIYHNDPKNNQRAEAMQQYQGVLDDYAKMKLEAAETLKQADRFKNDPDEKARMEALVRDPPPDYVARSTFFLGVMQYEDGKCSEALTRLNAFVQQFPTSALVAEAQLRQGFCQVQMKQFGDALKTLQTVADKEPRLADQALLWIGKAQVGGADPNNPQAYDQAVKNAQNSFRNAADRANQLAGADPEAKTRRGEILLELADAQQLAKQFGDAINTYNQVLNEKLLPAREEEVVQDLAAAQHLGGNYAESDKTCERFRTSYPVSPLLPGVLFRYAENAYFSALAADKLPNPQERQRETARWLDETIKRYQALVDKFPESPNVNLARYGLGVAYYQKGDLEKARSILEAIAPADRTGDLAVVPYQLADCIIRSAPANADDAVAAGKLQESLQTAIGLLDAFAAGQPNSPQAPDALLKLGYCRQRLAAMLVQPPDQAKALGSARASYEQMLQKYPKSDLVPQAIFERAKCMAQQKDIGGAMNELRRFTNQDPLKSSLVAPMAILELATLLRSQNQAQQAADVLAQARQQWEPKLQADPAHAAWITLLQYHHGVALREAGKRQEARGIFDQVVKAAPERPEAAEAALRFGQCLRDDGQQKVADAQKKLATPNLKPEETAAAQNLLNDGVKDLRDAVQYLNAQADQVKQKQPDSPVRARMFYEAAWTCRALADLEVKAARDKIQQEQWQKRKQEVAAKTPPGQTPPFVSPPDVPLSSVPLQPSEIQARAEYTSLINAFPDLAINADALFEMAELESERGEHDTSIKQLQAALDKEPSAELTDKIKVRLGAAYLAKGEAKKALDLLTPITNNPKSATSPQALYRAGECQLALGKPEEAVKLFAGFRDKGELQNLPGLTDRALLRLGYTLAQLKQWEPSRQAYEQVYNRFGNGPWANEARYGAGWALQNQNRFDEAVNLYAQVASATATELGARAQLNIGQCRLAQKRYPEATTALLVVPFTYDYPKLSALALMEAARGFAENNQSDQAGKLLERVIREYPDSEQADAAKKRLAELKKG